MDMVSVENEEYILVVKAKRSSIGNATKQNSAGKVLRQERLGK